MTQPDGNDSSTEPGDVNVHLCAYDTMKLFDVVPTPPVTNADGFHWNRLLLDAPVGSQAPAVNPAVVLPTQLIVVTYVSPGMAL